MLIGVGRWGSADPWLGIPVTWDQISGARVIVEAGFRDFRVTPSQGTHFFQNLTSFERRLLHGEPGRRATGFVDWDVAGRAAGRAAKGEFVRHVRLDAPAVVTIDGRSHAGLIMKPART